MTTLHYVNEDGVYLGGFGDGAEPPENSIEVEAPPHGLAKWSGVDWYFTSEDMAYLVRKERDSILKNVVDPVGLNALRWNALPQETKDAWMQYRQELLDLPQQEGFPFEVVWPVKPE